MIRAIICDMDGTLLNSMVEWDALGPKYLRGKGVSDTDIPSDIVDTLKPLSVRQVAVYMAERFEIRDTLEVIEAELNDMIKAAYNDTIELKAGVREFLEAHSHMPMCVATETEKYLAEPALLRRGISEYFRFVITPEDVGSGKREVHIFLEAARRLGYPPAEIAVVDDAFHAVKTAKAAGFHVIGVFDESYAAHTEAIKTLADEYYEGVGDIKL